MIHADAIAFLREWKELVGAAIGAITSVAVALMVANSAKRREDVSAAMVLVGNLTSIITNASTLEEKAVQEKIAPSDYHMWLASQLVSYRLPLSPLFDGCVARLMPVDVDLAVHLESVSVVYRGVEHHIERLLRDIEYFNEHQTLLRSEADVHADAEVIRKGIAMSAQHAVCAERLLTRLVISRWYWRTWHRFRRSICPTKGERECKCLLRTSPRRAQ